VLGNAGVHHVDADALTALAAHRIVVLTVEDAAFAV